MAFVEVGVDSPMVANALCVVGELNVEADIERLMGQGCVNLLDLVKD